MQEDLMRSRKQWQEHRERLATTEGELGHLSGIRDKSESLQAEMKAVLTRLSAAEAEGSRLRSEVERWRTNAGEADDRALALQSQLRDVERQRSEQKRQAQDLQVEVTSMSGRLQAAEGAAATLSEDKERLRALVELREEALSAERAKAQELAFQLRTIEHKSDSEKQRGGVKEEELNRVRVRVCMLRMHVGLCVPSHGHYCFIVLHQCTS
jgi:chromosome segregation ATPase